MALEDVVNAGKNYVVIKEIAGNIRKDPYNPENVGNFLAYANQAGREPLFQETQEEINEDPRLLRTLAERSAAREQGNLIDSVSRHYKEVVDALSEEKVRALAIDLEDEGKDFYEIIKKLKKGDIKGVKKDLSEICDNPVWRDLVTFAKGDLFHKLVQSHIRKKQEKWLEQYSTKVTKDEKKVKEIDYGKLRAYIRDTVTKYTDNQIKNQVYLATGKLYLDIQDERDEEEGNHYRRR